MTALPTVENYCVASATELDFDVCGIDAAILNSVRRVIMSDIVTIALERVFVANNTSVIPDEVLAHRLGLLPILADPALLTAEFDGNHEHFNAKNCLKFVLKAAATERTLVLSESMQWVPLEGQDSAWDVRVEPGIVVTKLAAGQQLDLELYAVKGTARDHAKWNPVCSAFYRQIPAVELLREVKGAEAEELKAFFTPGVIELDKHGRAMVMEGGRGCLQSPEYLKASPLAELVAIHRQPSKFVFHVETAAFFNPASVMVEACKSLKNKCLQHYESL